jgi:hypothetical protein
VKKVAKKVAKKAELLENARADLRVVLTAEKKVESLVARSVVPMVQT